VHGSLAATADVKEDFMKRKEMSAVPVLNDQAPWPQRVEAPPAPFFQVGNRVINEPTNDDGVLRYNKTLVARLEEKIRAAKLELKRLDDRKRVREDDEQSDAQRRRYELESIAGFEKVLAEQDAVKPKPTIPNITNQERFIRMVADFYYASNLSNKDVLLNFPADLLRACLSEQTEVGNRETGESSATFCRGVLGIGWGRTVADAAERARA
jgi:hypothetical protein